MPADPVAWQSRRLMVRSMSKTAFRAGHRQFLAHKISPRIFRHREISPSRALGSDGAVAAQTGMLESPGCFDNGYLNLMCALAAAGAVRGAPSVAHRCVAVPAILGAAGTGKLQLKALCLVGRSEPANHCWAGGIRTSWCCCCCNDRELGIESPRCCDPVAAVSEADIIVTTTPAPRRSLRADWLKPGQHIHRLGLNSGNRTRSIRACFARCRSVCPDRLSQNRGPGVNFRNGDCHGRL